MKHNAKKILSLLLTLVLVLSLVPAASADVSITERDIYNLRGKMYNLANEKIDAEDFAAVEELYDAMDDLEDAYYEARGEVTDAVVAAYNNAMNVYLKYTATVAVTGVTIKQGESAVSEITLDKDATTALTAVVDPDNATDKTVTWTTSDSNVASVANGVVTATGVGTATITATATNGTADTADDIAATCTVKVNAAGFTVTVVDTQNGTVTADKTTAAANDTITLTITPASGYQVQAITVTDVDNNPVTVTNNSFTMPAANVTVTVTFIAESVQPTTYTVTYDANGGSGTMPSWSGKAGTEIEIYTCRFTPPEGKEFDKWLCVERNTTYNPGQKITVDQNLTLKAQWKDEKKPDGGEKKTGGSGSGFDLVFNIPGEDNSWGYGGGYAPQQAYRVSLAPMQGGSAALGLTTGESTETAMNVYPTTTVYVFPNAEQGYVLDKIVWSLIDGSASYDITEAKNFVMPAMDVVVYVTFKPVG